MKRFLAHSEGDEMGIMSSLVTYSPFFFTIAQLLIGKGVATIYVWGLGQFPINKLGTLLTQ